MLQTFGIGVIIGFLLWSPDFILKVFIPTVKVAFSFSEFLSLIGIGVLLAFMRSRVFAYLTLIVLWFMLMIQLNHQGYFGAPIGPVEISRLFEDSRDIWMTAKESVFYLWPISFVLIFNYGLIVVLLRKRTVSFPYLPLVVMVLMANNTARLWKHEIAQYMVNPFDHSIRKSVNFFNMWLISLVTRKTVDISGRYKPYNVSFEPVNQQKTIILIMGESATYTHMSLYGYGRSTTPHLDKRKRDKHFGYTKGISGSVSTPSALSLFFNTMREPGHLALIDKKEANLWNIAKKQGFSTILISAQEAKLVHHCGSEHNDVVISNESPEGENFKRYGDFGLLKILKNQKLGRKNFIVLHQEILHSPYDAHYAKYPQFDVYKQSNSDRFQYTINSYDNAMLLADQIWEEIIQYAKTLPGEVTIVFTSDHGEMLGEKGLLGHNLLEIEAAQVGMWCHSSNPDNVQWFKEKHYRTHYDLSKWLAKQMGATIKNSNDEEGVGFVHARNLYENYKYLKINCKNGSPKVEGSFIVDDHLPVKDILYTN